VLSDLSPWVAAAYGTVVLGVLAYVVFVRSRLRHERRRELETGEGAVPSEGGHSDDSPSFFDA
jgi:hypothetical protein